MPVVAQRILRLFVFGKHQQSRGVAVQAMHDVHAVLPARTLHIFVQNGVGGTLFLPFRIDGQQSLHLLHHDEVSIFVYDFQ